MGALSVWEYGALFHEHEKRARRAEQQAGRRPGSKLPPIDPNEEPPPPEEFERMRANIRRMMPDARV